MSATRSSPAETELYRPIYEYLVAQGYTVRGEVKDCDVAATKGDELIVIELKRSINVALLAQAVDRQRATDSVYIAVPRPPSKRKWLAQSVDVQHLLRRLELGLILVSTESGKPPVDIVFHPAPHERRKRSHKRRAILKEIERRSTDLNVGGSCRRTLVTAYRENAVQIAVCLSELGPLSPKALRTLGAGDGTGSILTKNYYSWFERIERGVYALTDRGRAEIDKYPELVTCYREKLRTQCPAELTSNRHASVRQP